jgi:hypothetical protein
VAITVQPVRQQQALAVSDAKRAAERREGHPRFAGQVVESISHSDVLVTEKRPMHTPAHRPGFPMEGISWWLSPR